jgi:hypothetical protein
MRNPQSAQFASRTTPSRSKMVERVYPGVYVTEIPFDAKPIEGVPTASPHADAVRTSGRSPDWTEHQPSDAGITLAQLFAWVGESSLFRAQPTEVQSTQSVHHIRKKP